MIRNRIRNAAAALVVAAGLTAGLAGQASADSASVAKVTIKYNGDGFEGKVKSDKSKCLRDRQVQVYKANGTPMYMDTTETDGSWNTGNSGQVRGRFYATVQAKGNCLALQSKTIRVQG